MILILSILFTTALVLGVTIATQQGMIGYWLRQKSEGKRLLEPIITCHWCMPSLWSLAGYGFAFMYCGYDESQWKFYVITICASSILCGAIWGIIQIITKKAAQ